MEIGALFEKNGRFYQHGARPGWKGIDQAVGEWPPAAAKCFLKEFFF
jgi:hypothetical protein